MLMGLCVELRLAMVADEASGMEAMLDGASPYSPASYHEVRSLRV